MKAVERPLVAGVGMTHFTKPSQKASWIDFGFSAARSALDDAGIEYKDIQQAFVGYVYGDSTAGQSVLYKLGLTGVPIFNVNNNCSTGSTALFLACQAVGSGVIDVALVVGFEQMNPGAQGLLFNDRAPVMAMHSDVLRRYHDWRPDVDPPVAQFFGGAGIEHQEKYGTRTQTFAKIAEKARRHAANNPYAVFREPLSLEEILASKHVYGPLTRYQCCPPTSGAAAAVVVSPRFAKHKGLHALIEIAGQSMTTDFPSSFGDKPSMISTIGYDMARIAADKAYEQAGVGPSDIGLVELHDCFTVNELVSYEALGLCAPGDAEKFIEDGDNTYGGKCVTNPSGGLLSKGHPLGATGLAQCAEIVWQLRGVADRRQVENARFGLQHNLGFGGACVVTVYRDVRA